MGALALSVLKFAETPPALAWESRDALRQGDKTCLALMHPLDVIWYASRHLTRTNCCLKHCLSIKRPVHMQAQINFSICAEEEQRMSTWERWDFSEWFKTWRRSIHKCHAPVLVASLSQALSDYQMWPLKSHKLRKKWYVWEEIWIMFPKLSNQVRMSRYTLERNKGALRILTVLCFKGERINLAALWLPGSEWNIRNLFQFLPRLYLKEQKILERRASGNGTKKKHPRTQQLRGGVWSLHSHLCLDQIVHEKHFLSFNYSLFTESKTEHEYFWLFRRFHLDLCQ